MREVAIVGAGMTQFGELWETSLRQLFADAALEAIRSAGVDRLDGIYVGNMSAGRFVDQEHVAIFRREGPAYGTELDVVADVRHVAVAEPGVVQALDGVVDVEALLGLAGGLDVPLLQRHGEALGHVLGQQGLPGAGLSLDQQRSLERNGGVDGVDEGRAGDVALGPLEAEEVVGFTHGSGILANPPARGYG